MSLLIRIASFLIGFGSFKIALLVSMLIPVTMYPFGKFDFYRFKNLAFCASPVVLFILLYIIFYKFPLGVSANLIYIPTLLLASALSLLLPLLCKTNERLIPIVYFSVGTYAFSSLSVLLSFMYIDPPFYGSVLDLHQFIKGEVCFNNSPGVSNLLIFLPIVSAALLLAEEKPKNIPIILLILVLFFAVISATALWGRSFFILIFIIFPVLYIALSIAYKMRIHWFVPLSFVLLSFFVYTYINSFHAELLHRKIDSSIFNDGRFLMFKHAISQIYQHPFYSPTPGPGIFTSSPWFHNFFIDIYRSSGFIVFIVSILIFAYIATIIVVSRKFDKLSSYVLMLVYTCVLPLLLTSVVPEGELQPFLVYLIIFSTALSILCLNQKK